jgi:aarF domain-containing kinase
MDNWYGLLHAAIEKDREDCIDYSRKLGYLTGEENEVNLNPHSSLIRRLRRGILF